MNITDPSLERMTIICLGTNDWIDEKLPLAAVSWYGSCPSADTLIVLGKAIEGSVL